MRVIVILVICEVISSSSEEGTAVKNATETPIIELEEKYVKHIKNCSCYIEGQNYTDIFLGRVFTRTYSDDARAKAGVAGFNGALYTVMVMAVYTTSTDLKNGSGIYTLSLTFEPCYAEIAVHTGNVDLVLGGTYDGSQTITTDACNIFGPWDAIKGTSTQWFLDELPRLIR